MALRSYLGMLLSLACSVLAPATHAGEAEAVLRGSRDRFLVSRWGLAEGLPQSSPNALALTSDGYLWVGTEQGLARFDGLSFTVWDTRHGLPGERVVEMLAAPSGLWVATLPGGLSLFDAGAFVPVLPGELVSCLARVEPEGVWVGTSNGLYRIAGGVETAPVPVPVPRRVGTIHALLDEGSGALIAGHTHGLSRRAADGAWTDLAHGALEPPVTGLARAGEALWVAARNGFWRLSGGSWERMTEGSESHPGVSVDDNGEVWLWSVNRGVRRWHGGQVRGVKELSGIDDHVFRVLPGEPDTVWIGTGSAGLVRLRRPLIDALTLEHGLPAWAVHGVVEDDEGRLWLGSLGAGLTRLGATGVRTFREADGLPGDSVLALALDASGRLWVGMNRGLAVGDGDGNEFRAVEVRWGVKFGPVGITALWPEADGSLLFAAAGGVFRLRDDGVERLTERVFRDSGIYLLYRDRRGNLWIGGDGLCRLLGDDLECHGREAGLPPHLVRSAFEPRGGELWFGTYGGGLCRLEEGPSFRCISEEQGLPRRTVHAILPDGLGWVWLPSNRGLGRARMEELERAFDDPGHAIRGDVFGLEDGLADLEHNGGVQPGGVVLRDGRLALATMRGLALVDPGKAAAVGAVAPVAHVESVVVDGAEMLPERMRRLAAGSDRIIFHYTGIHPRAPRSVRFRYRLDGHDEGWLAAGDRRSVSYTGLSPGLYRFRVQASVGDSPWSREAAVRLELPPFFWQTSWFAASVVLVLAAVLAFLYRLRVRRLLELERVRLHIAADLHDELSSELSGIALSSALARRQAYLREPERRRLEEIESGSRQVISGLRDLVWAINPEHDTLGAMVARMRSVAGQLLEDLEWSFEETWTSADVGVGMAARRDLYLIFKEALTNVLRHARATQVAVRLDRVDDSLRLEIEDDGVGFDAGAEAPGSGIRSMRTRAQRLGAGLVVESRPGEGTKVRLDCPLAGATAKPQTFGRRRRPR